LERVDEVVNIAFGSEFLPSKRREIGAIDIDCRIKRRITLDFDIDRAFGFINDPEIAIGLIAHFR
jgi:hypothetical protein